MRIVVFLSRKMGQVPALLHLLLNQKQVYRKIFSLYILQKCTYLEDDRFDNFDFVLEEATDDKPPDDGRTWFHPNDIRISLVLEPAQYVY